MAESDRQIGWAKLSAFGALYVSFGATLGFLAGGAPLILRVRGVELAQVGILQVVNLPLGLTFLWAFAIDRFRVPGLPHRIGWIALLQLLGILCLVVLAMSGDASLGVLLAIGVATCICIATMDISLEALVVETIAAADRPYVSSAKFCGASLGGILGAGVIVGSYEQLGWVACVAIVASLNLVSLLPVLFYPERQARRADALVPQGERLERLRALGGHIGVLGFYFAALYAISGMNGLALIDLGLPLSTVGHVSGTLSPLINLTMAVSSAYLVRRFGTVPLITTFAIGLLAATSAMAAAAAFGMPWLGIGATICTYVCSSGLGVPVFNMLYRWSEGPRAATDYSILFGAAFFAAMPMRVGGPAVASAMGWAGFYVLAICLYACAFLILRRSIAVTLASQKA